MEPMKPITCPICGDTMHQSELALRAKAAVSFATCLRRCDPCGVGASNGRSNPTFIYLDPLHNLPIEARSGAIEAIANALNVRNRSSKHTKFGYSSSEDALTWAVFSFLERERSLGPLISSLGLLPVPPTCEPTMLMWGSAVPSQSRRCEEVRQKIVAILDSIGEHSQSYSEPDVVLDFDSYGLVIIEVKYKSGNAVDRNRNKFTKYLNGSDAFRLPERIIESGLYDLARNFRIGSELADGRAMKLVNLLLPTRIRSEERLIEQFKAGLSQSERLAFEQVSWPHLLRYVPMPDWLAKYIGRLGVA